MADPEVRIAAGGPTEGSGDVEMQGGDDAVEVGETGADDAPVDVVEDETALETYKPVPRVTYVEYVTPHFSNQTPLKPNQLTVTYLAISNPP